MKLSKIKPNPNNPRIVKDDKFKKLVKSIKEFPKMMELRPMVIDKEGIVLGGNMRLKALKELKYKDIPDNWVKFAKDLTEEEKKRFIIADNVGFGLWDWEQLANEWDEEQLIDWGLDIPDFETEELEAVEDDYSEPEQMQVDIVEGDLVEFVCTDGRVHRLLCGDSTCSDSVVKLMDGKKADMVFTDPPYGIKYDRHIKNKKAHQEMILNDDCANGWLVNMPDDCPCFICTRWDVYPKIYSEISEKLNIRNVIVWDKKTNGMGDTKTTFAPSHEFIVYATDRTYQIKGERFRDVWTVGRDSGLHPTMKPAALISKAINSVCKKRGLILDLFLGSGSTLVAAHQLERTCYGMELDCKYCQVIIDRMTKLDETLTVKINGKEYKKEGAEVPF